MPKDNIDRAIKKAAGGDADAYEEIRYEGFGPGGAGLIVEVLTDNRNRAAANVRSLLVKNGGNLGETNSVSFMFERLGQILYPATAGSEDAITEAAIEAGAEDVVAEEEGFAVLTRYEDLMGVVDALEASLGPARTTGVIWRPKVETPVDEEQTESLSKLIDALEDDDDVQNVWTNAA